MRLKYTVAAIALAFSAFALGQTPTTPQSSPDPPNRTWQAQWITHPTAPLRDPIVLHFRRTLRLADVPPSYTVRVSADNRFILYVNGQRVGDGPARGDLNHWRYERFDLAPLLKTGDNLITAVVWNFGVYAPIAQMSDRTAFILESEATGDQGISTPAGWQISIDPGHRVLDPSHISIKNYVAAGQGEEIDGARTNWSWQNANDSSSDWVQPGDPMRESIYPGTSGAHSADITGDNPWGLVPDELPHMEYAPTDAGRSVAWKDFTSAITSQSSSIMGFETSSGTIVAPHVHVHVLLDRKTLTTAYPQLTVSGGKGSKIVLTYAEALYDDHLQKGDRDAVEGRKALGFTDVFLPDGGPHRAFQPLWWRTWRYLDIDITTDDDPLTLESLKANFTAYPFEERASFDSPDPDLAKIWDISWRTARLDAHETYMDTPYWEQLQYIGDTRIQALISYAVGGDDRLGRQALNAFNDSRIPEGITRSRYPSSLPQNIPTFSLLWIGMVHDWWMYRPDPAPVRESLQGTRSVLQWFAQYEQPDGLLRKVPWWSFIDWVNKGEIPTYSARGESCVTTLEYLGALQQAADLEHAFGDPAIAAQHSERAGRIRTSLYKQCWSADRHLLADNPDKTVFSQQANVLAVLYDVIPPADQRVVLKHVLAIEPGTSPDGVLSASYYFRFYLSRALEHANMADDYLASLKPWRDLLPLHFSTWPETPAPTRSDSHAWTSHPIYDLLTLVAGIEPASPGFATVRIAPHLGDLPSLTATFPHPAGNIAVDYRWTPEKHDAQMKGGRTFHAAITLPGALTGTFHFNGRDWPLKPGQNQIDVPMK